ncbi:MAG: EAL domain-containing protein [Gammaproteobacteria bacterium]|nr:EAL domain-containing protein [Gammaproteobacteria bacterium]MBU1555371.1 EAL domain-containing protein [Gammaproteobacteria bacterium]MBU2071574.1 EAL domain-containing protein [Gammaproteobacteria bacterium]MBU2184064.1 EAL domain-containing protein [Gammaproteobacteria bacterium]MBU2206850.1 EAL domain-containing protein [Gammaproteobacteria bacterium]
MPRYLSLSWKILLLMLSMLLILLLWFTGLSLLHMNDQFTRQQAQRKAQGQQYFDVYNQSSTQQLLTWLQTQAELQQLHLADDFNQFAASLPQQFEPLQQNFAVQQLYLWNQQQQLLYSSAGATEIEPAAVVVATLQQQQPQSDTRCGQICEKQLTLPLLNRHGEIAVLQANADMAGVLFSLHQALGVDVALVQVNADNAQQQLRLLLASNRELLRQLYQVLPAQFDLATAREEGLILQLQQQSYFIHFITLAPAQSDAYVLLMLEDVSAAVAENSRYQQRVLTMAAACFLLLLLLIMLITRRISRRILQLAAALPLLAQRRYAAFRQQSQLPAAWFADELTTFNDSVLSLNNQLETLDLQLAENTASLQRMAMVDQLTALANRNMLQQRLAAALANLTQQPGVVALLFLDLDKFKTINNSRSHVVGDQLLIETARRLETLATPQDLVCRFGGDEFAILLSGLTATEQAETMAMRVLALFEQPFVLAQVSLRLSASIGISYTQDAQQDGDELIRCADLAMYQAKASGRNCYVVFNQQMSADLAARIQLETELRQALLLQQFSLSLQPQVNLSSGKLCGFEALIRWQHPQRGIVAPDEFIPVLEQTQLIVDVGYWVFDRSCRYCAELIAAGLNDVTIAVNISADQFLHTKLPDRFGQILQRYGLSGHHFELEITESTLINNFSETLGMMYRLKAQGFRLAIDDFGTGYSSLNYLKQMPVDVIKIDKSFVVNMLDNPQDYQIVASTIAMVQKLGLQVVAEGVESFAVVKLLQQHQCDFAQGYYFSKPLAETQLPVFVQQVLQQHWPAALLPPATQP